MTTYAADSITPLKIPEIYRAARNHGVGLYANGDYVVSSAIAKLFPRKYYIGVYGNNPQQGDYCDELDVEQFDATSTDWPPFRHRRDQWCVTNNSNRWPKVYCSIDPDAEHGVIAIVEACRAAGQELPQHWHIAWYPQTGAAPTAIEVAQEIERLTGEVIPVETIWGVQWTAGAHYDQSVIFQHPRWA